MKTAFSGLLGLVFAVSALAAETCQLPQGERILEVGKTFALESCTWSCDGGVGSKELWVNGMDTGVRAIGCEAGKNLLTFNFSQQAVERPDKKTEQAWTTLLRNPFDRKLDHFERPVVISIRENGVVLAVGDAHLRLLDRQHLMLGAGTLMLLLVMLLGGTLKSGLIRDAGLPPSGGKDCRPYSLARLQMVWWFAIVFMSYVLLWLINHDLPSISPAALALIGMAGGTAVAGAAIDAGRPVAVSRSFWYDIATDANGITLPRLQQIAWTAILGVVFISSVLNSLAMPDFDNSTLALMGISAGTYLGFKVPESHAGDSKPTVATVTPTERVAPAVVAVVSPVVVPVSTPPDDAEADAPPDGSAGKA